MIVTISRLNKKKKIFFCVGAGSSVSTAQPAGSITEAVASEAELSANRDDQQENQYMDVDDSLEPMVLLAPDGGWFYFIFLFVKAVINNWRLKLILKNYKIIVQVQLDHLPNSLAYV